MRRWYWSVLATCAMASLLSGCTSVHLYSPARDKQGQEAQKAWGEVDLAAQVEVPRKNLKSLLDEQLAIEDEVWSAYRSARARSMAYSWDLTRMRDAIDARHMVLAGVATPDELKKNRDELRRAKESLQSIATSNAIAGQPPPDCAALRTDDGLQQARQAAAALPAAPGAVVLATLDAAAADCRSIAHLVSAGGELGQATELLAAEREAVAADERKAAELKKAYDAAKQDYDATATTLLGDPNDKSAKEAVDRAVARLGSLVKSVESAQDAFSTKFITSERLASLDGFLTTYNDIAAGKAVEDGNKVAIALAVFPDIRDKARASLRDLQKPNLVALAVQKNVELAKLEAAQRDIDLRQQLVAQREAQVAALDAQVEALAEARGAFRDPAVNTLLAQPLVQVMNQKDDAGLEVRIKLWRATTRFLDAEGRLRAEVGKTRYRISALEHEKALTYAESNINQWKALIDPSVDLMATYGAAGLKSSDLMALFNSLTLLWIGAGVN